MIKKGLKVRVLTGKDKKKEGEVIEIDRANNRAKIKEINMFISLIFALLLALSISITSPSFFLSFPVKTLTFKPFLIIIKPPVPKK